MINTLHILIKRKSIHIKIQELEDELVAENMRVCYLIMLANRYSRESPFYQLDINIARMIAQEVKKDRGTLRFLPITINEQKYGIPLIKLD